MRLFTMDFRNLHIPTFIAVVIFILSFCSAAAIDLDALGNIVDRGYQLCIQYLGFSWQILFLTNFIIGVLLCFHPGSRRTLGDASEPEFSFFQWSSMIMCTLLAGGGIFWAAGEPIAHFLNPPPFFGVKAGFSRSNHTSFGSKFSPLGVSCMGYSWFFSSCCPYVLSLRKKAAFSASDSFIPSIW